MGTDQSAPTSPTLLGRLRQDPLDQPGWAEFVARYRPKLYDWCRRWGLQDADAQDVSQQVLVRLSGLLKTFVYDPSRSFRGWLRELTRHAWSDFLAAQQRPDRGTGDSNVLDLLNQVQARDDLVARLKEEFDYELLQEAMARARLRVEPQTWDAYRMTAVQGKSGAEAARLLNMKLTAVFKAKNRFQHLISEEIARLEQRPAS